MIKNELGVTQKQSLQKFLRDVKKFIVKDEAVEFSAHTYVKGDVFFYIAGTNMNEVYLNREAYKLLEYISNNFDVNYLVFAVKCAIKRVN